MIAASQNDAPSSSFAKALAWLHRIEGWVLTVLVLAMVLLAGAQIVLRNAFGGGFAWADPLLRSLVVWTALLGALSAVREDKHIAIDVLQRFLPPRGLRIARFAAFGFAAAICAALAWYSFAMVQIDFMGGAARNDAILPAWLIESILPFAFALMAVRFMLRAFAPATHAPGIAAELLHDPAGAAARDARTPR